MKTASSADFILNAQKDKIVKHATLLYCASTKCLYGKYLFRPLYSWNGIFNFWNCGMELNSAGFFKVWSAPAFVDMIGI